MKNEDKYSLFGLYLRRLFSYLVLIILTLLCLIPFYVLFVNSSRSHYDIQKGFSFIPGTYLIRNLKKLLSDANLPVLRGIINSFVIAASSSVLSVYFSSLTAYAVHAYDFKLKKLLYSFILMVMMVPTQVTSLGFIKLVREVSFLRNTYWPLIIPSITAPIVVFFIKQYMETALPVEIVEAARIDGSHEFHTFNKIVLPIMKPAIAVQMIFSFTSSWNNYFIPALVLAEVDKNKKTLPILIAQLRSADFLKFDMGELYMMIAVSIFPIVVIYLILSKQIVSGVAMGGVKG